MNFGCFIEIPGCVNQESDLFDPNANTNDGSCDIITAIEDQEILHSLQIYPNPVEDKALIEFDGTLPAVLKIVDLSGKLLREETVKTPVYSFLTKDLPPGMYILSMGNSSQIYSTKIILK